MPVGDLPHAAIRHTMADDVGFIRELTDWVVAAYRVDSRRIYLTGASNGGMMAYRLVMGIPE